jgi:acyl transferase domain-containing protein/acyl carrier protein
MNMMPEPTSNNNDLDQLKRALSALKKARARIDSLERAHSEPIAVIGIGCRLPGDANTPQSFWELLRSGRSAIVEPSLDRWDARAFQDTDPDMPGKLQSSSCGFIQDVDQFDPHFFGITPREANAMDPQQRLALEASWEALEDAGIIPGSLAGSNTGVFIGIGLNDYGRLQIPGQALDRATMDPYFIQGNALCITANRISYVLDLRGPSMAIDTACSSSLVAVHNACHSLRSGESTLALVGGSNVILAPDNSIGLKNFLSPDGLCKAFDSSADGYTRGEGVIILVLKRLSEAEAARDRIYAVIRGSAINQDGFSSGLTVPNGVAQEALLRAALNNSGLSPDDIDYVEAHGTGTALGDPIEANALGAVFAEGRESGGELLLGSVKTNIGHLEAGAGIAGMLKVVLALYHAEIPPSLNFIEPNPLIDFEKQRLKVVTALTPWPKKDRPSRAGVSSFGFGGANAHTILEAYQPESMAASENSTINQEEPESSQDYLLTLSAKTPQALRDYARRFAEFFHTSPSQPLADVCQAANRRRSHFPFRLAVTDTTPEGFSTKLKAFVEGESTPGLTDGQAKRNRPKLVFLFTGQGSQYLGMGRQLYEKQPVYRTAMDRCDEVLRPILDESLLQILYPDIFDNPTIASSEAQIKIDNTHFTQPALFAFEYALSELWRSWGVEPDVVVGHSVGEYVAACVAGVMSLEDGLRLIAARGRLMGALPEGGGMAAVFAPLESIQHLLKETQISVAAINGPDNVVISGSVEEIQEVLNKLHAQGFKFRPLVVSHAFHSSRMDPILDEFESVAQTCHYAPPRIMLISNTTGKPFAPGEIPGAAYWRQHIRSTVNYASGMQALFEQSVEIFLEIGPHPTLLGMGKRCLNDDIGIWLPSLRQGHSEMTQMYRSLGSLYCQGYAVNWAALENDGWRKPVSLPTYPFQHERYWFSQAPITASILPSKLPTVQKGQPLLGKLLQSPLLKERVYESQIIPETLGYLWDHRVFGSAVFPATAYIAMVLSAAVKQQPDKNAILEDFTILQAIILPEDSSTALQLTMAAQEEDRYDVKIYSPMTDTVTSDNLSWTLHASATISWGVAQSLDNVTLEQAQRVCVEGVDPGAFYESLHQSGMGYGLAFQGIQRLWKTANQALAHVVLPEDLLVTGEVVHPALLDACLQTLGLCLPDSTQVFLPIGMNRVEFYTPPGNELWSYAQVHTGENTETLHGDIHLFDKDSQIVGRVTGIHLKQTNYIALQKLIQRNHATRDFSDWLYRMEWQSQSLPDLKGAQGIASPCLIIAGTKLGELLASNLDGALLGVPGKAFAQVASNRWSVDPAKPEDFHRLIAQVNPGTIIIDSSDAKTVLRLLQAVCAQSTPAYTWLVTQGSQPVFSGLGGSEDVIVEPAALWGMARSVRLEYLELRIRCIDVDPAALPEHSISNLLAEFGALSEEDEIAYRNDERFVLRMARHSLEPVQSAPVHLEITRRGVMDQLAWRPIERRPLAIGEVEIAVRATGLNFRDVLNTLGLYPGDAGALGHECSGVVTAVGTGVTEFAPGDAVFGLASDCFASFATMRHEFLMLKPPEMSFEQAATIPIAFLTAEYSLNTLGKMKPGEKVLIHAAAGGVGLAAVQLALRCGAEIFATAGSPGKRELLHSMGVPHVLDSRSLTFAEEIMHLTAGEGVDIVLNSLADEFIPKSLSVLKPGGRFLEIGKRGIWSHEQVSALGKMIEYHIIYLGEVCEREPGLIHDLFIALTEAMKSGALHPLPWRAFPTKQAAEAFRFMAQAKHVGKIVVTQPSVLQESVTAEARFVCSDRSYLVTGGLGGLGLKIAQWLVEAGARNVIVFGRHAPSESAKEVLEKYQPSILPVQVDVSNFSEVQRVIETIQKEQPPLAGIVHTAGVLEDGLLQDQNGARYDKVFAPKLDAAWHLHHLTKDMPLDFFILFSAGAGWLGSAGQSGYAAANSAVDALAHYRRARGMPALSLAWGPWADVGMAARLDKGDQERMARQGLGSIPPKVGVEIFGTLMGHGGSIGVLPIDWRRYAAAKEVVPTRFSDLTREVQSKFVTGSTTSKAKPDILHNLAEVPQNKRKSLLQTHVREQAVRVLGLSASYTLDARQPLREIGMDSLMAVELRNALAASLQHKLPSTLLFDYPTLEALTDFLNSEFTVKEEEPAPKSWINSTQKSATSSTQNVVDINRLTDEEAEAQLLAELDEQKKK